MRPLIVLGTANRKKAAELVELMPPQFELLTLADIENPLEIDESGGTFAENAALKATRQAAHLHEWVLGDDSGLTVDALDGAPGLFSARFAGPNCTDADNRRKLLEQLAHVERERRTACFVCHLALADPDGKLVAESSGRCRGRIRALEAGSGGFGYDPLFEVVEYHRTFGELGPAAKSCLTHRARAVQAIVPLFVELVISHEVARG
jgi:XTP/dITP diphosphohydrolase